jgi:Cdc6-like AAA superfamily ATPase
VSSRLDVYEHIRDQRVRSNFVPRVILFPPYSAEEPEKIVKLRAEEVLEGPLSMSMKLLTPKPGVAT